MINLSSCSSLKMKSTSWELLCLGSKYKILKLALDLFYAQCILMPNVKVQFGVSLVHALDTKIEKCPVNFIKGLGFGDGANGYLFIARRDSKHINQTIGVKFMCSIKGCRVCYSWSEVLKLTMTLSL